jgi:2-oxoglutarate dehydrogenase E2 component (dihydrolipoamide succinyltransferase)
MGKFEFKLPAMGEGIIEATITKWFVNEGDEIEEEDTLVEVATDKVDSEVPAPRTGKIEKIIFAEGDTPKIGDVILIMEVEGEESNKLSTEEVKAENKNTDEILLSAPASANHSISDLPPFIINLARERGITLEELCKIKGTGEEGAITKNDLNVYILQGKPFANGSVVNPNKPKSQPVHIPVIPEGIAPSKNANYDIIEMSRMRQLIASHMVESVHRSPHVTSFVEADVTDLVLWRNANKKAFQKKYGEKLTFTSLFFEIAAKSLIDFPDINVSVDDNKIIKKHYINIGMATALTDGNLIVPVIKNTDKLSLAGIVQQVNEMSQKARENKLLPKDTADGTFTITNVGNFDNLTGTPIINQPEVAILAIGAIKRKPAVVNTPNGETIGIRSIVMLSLSYDHRVVDGALGGSFLRKIQQYCEEFDTSRSI